ncbi:Hypothetical protein GbCGDNIH6_0378 [Granulibacter bethesdensis]|nr:Hypothetical protein GbCGDNIH6_0378 [Granulibacter bethesdensis]
MGRCEGFAVGVTGQQQAGKDGQGKQAMPPKRLARGTGIKERKAGHKAVSCTAFLPEAGRGGLSIGRDTQALADRGGNVQLRSGQDWQRKAAKGQTKGADQGGR